MHPTERVVLVTGAARRVGRAIALEMARIGSRVAVHYHTSSEAAQETVEECVGAGGRANAFAADLADPSATTRLVQNVLGQYGRLDVLVNNASVFDRMTIDTFDLTQWEATLRVNVTAPMQLVYAARDALRAARGHVVNIGDVAVERHWPDHLAYIVSKGALHTLTGTLARALAPEVQVVGVAPGIAVWPPDYDEATRARLLERVPLGRAGTPEGIARTVRFLVCEGDYLTGTMVPVDGGRHLH